MEGGKERVVAHSIKIFENHEFLRVQRSFMINPSYVKQYNSEQEVVTMSNGQIANIWRRRRGILKSLVA